MGRVSQIVVVSSNNLQRHYTREVDPALTHSNGMRMRRGKDMQLTATGQCVTKADWSGGIHGSRKRRHERRRRRRQAQRWFAG